MEISRHSICIGIVARLYYGFPLIPTIWQEKPWQWSETAKKHWEPSWSVALLHLTEKMMSTPTRRLINGDANVKKNEQKRRHFPTPTFLNMRSINLSNYENMPNPSKGIRTDIMTKASFSISQQVYSANSSERQANSLSVTSQFNLFECVSIKTSNKHAAWSTIAKLSAF